MEPSPHQPPRRARLTEHHAHIYEHGVGLGMLDLSAVTSPGDMLDRIAERVGERARTPESAILAHGARPDAWDPPTWPTLAQLDSLCDHRPIAAWCFDHHALMANSAALAVAGIHASTPNPPDGLIGRDERGRLTGVLYEAAAARLWTALPPLTPRERRAAVIAALDDFARHGFAQVHDLRAPLWLATELRDLDASGSLPVDVVLWPLVEDLPSLHAAREHWQTPRVRLGGGKIFVDGTLSSRTAWMLHDYADPKPGHPRGLPMMDPARITAAVRTCDALGLPLAAHAIGDAAVRAVLDAIEEVRPRTRGFRIEHAELIDDADVPRFARLGVAASVQPCHLLYDIEALTRGLPDRLDRVLPLRDLVASGCQPGELILFGSDAPIVRPDPGDSLQASIERRRVGMLPKDAIGPGQRLTLDESLAAFGAR